ncbi:uncharacterized protein F4817DRAFT_313167 [Daldinia loculata]|uniref:uncharacterized protein n=1 Tax=Daldinia loculata TaxID=103429 RepID=UPI0020C2DF5A|nr:uncharacterized protein F4817DRAFT_313167 [Daldinia loculata]KAI1650310.1 hypothetical protein F4817DRAFT_313167 [Daldinia loculata]
MGSPVPPEAPFTYAYLVRFAFLGVVKRIHAPTEASVYLASSAQPATSAIQVIIRIASPLMMNCLQNPCDQGCPDWDLIPARLDDDENIAAPFLPSPRNSSAETGRIVGFSIMGVVILLSILGVIFWRRKIRRKIMNVWESYIRRYRRSNDYQSNEARDDLQPENLDHGSSRPGSEPSSTTSSGTARTYETNGPLEVVNK